MGDVNSAIEHFDKETEQRAKFLRADGERPILDFKRLYLSSPQFFELAGNYARLSLTDKETATPNFPSVAIERRQGSLLCPQPQALGHGKFRGSPGNNFRCL